VLRGGAIGDFIVTLPALNALRRRWPDAHVEIVGYPRIAGLAEAAGIADRVVSLDSADVARFFSLCPELSEEQRDYVCSFDLVISYLFDPDGTVKRNLLAAGARQVIYGSPRVEGMHAIEYLMRPLEELALYPEGGEQPRLDLAAAHRTKGRDRAGAFGESVIAVHPGSGSPDKNWPLDGFVELARKIGTSTSHTPVFILGEADAAIAASLRETGNPPGVLTGCTLLELAQTLSACRGYVGNDSGVTHIAAAVGIPVVALFGPSDPDTWGPRGDNVSIVRAPDASAEGLGRVGVDEVYARLAAGMG